MRRLAPLAFFLMATVCTSTPALAVTVGGTLTYAGLPVSTTFSGMQSMVLDVYQVGVSRTSYSFPVGDSYQVPVDLPAGEYMFWLGLTPEVGATTITARSGDLYAQTGTVQIPDQASYTVDMALQYCPHVTQPVDSLQTWPGSATACPYGALQPDVFALAWDPVPLAVRYEVQVYRYSCTSYLRPDSIPTTDPSVEIMQRQAAGEEYIDILVNAFDAGDHAISHKPYVAYGDAKERQFFTFNAVQQSGRSSHSVGQFVSQVASTPGVGTSFWSTDLTLTNPTSSDVTTTLYYTPRDADGLTSYQEAEVTVPAGACREWPDIVGTELATSGAGALEVASPALIVASRTFTPAAGGGAYGQGVIAIQPDQVLTAVGMKARAGGVMKAGAARSNLALNEVWGESATATVTLMDRDGMVLGSQDVTLQPYSSTQINDLVVKLAELSSLSEGQVEVSLKSGTGRIAATLFLADESDDPATVPLYALP